MIWSFSYAAVYFIFLDKLYGMLQMFTFLTIPILAQYNGERGKWKGMKWSIKTDIFSMCFLTRASSNSVMSISWLAIKV